PIKPRRHEAPAMVETGQIRAGRRLAIIVVRNSAGGEAGVARTRARNSARPDRRRVAATATSSQHRRQPQDERRTQDLVAHEGKSFSLLLLESRDDPSSRHVTITEVGRANDKLGPYPGSATELAQSQTCLLSPARRPRCSRRGRCWETCR